MYIKIFLKIDTNKKIFKNRNKKTHRLCLARFVHHFTCGSECKRGLCSKIICTYKTTIENDLTLLIVETVFKRLFVCVCVCVCVLDR